MDTSHLPSSNQVTAGVINDLNSLLTFVIRGYMWVCLEPIRPEFPNQAEICSKYARYYRFLITINLLCCNMDVKLLDVALASMKTSGCIIPCGGISNNSSSSTTQAN